MNISDEAVEAAAKVYRDQQSELGYPKWEDLPEDGREWRRDYMRAALEAAAPHMLAEAFDYGWREGKGIPTPVNIETGELIHNQSTQSEFNPYRRQA